MRYVTVNKFAWLDPTNEILKGPAQGKSAGQFNQLTAQQVNIGDPNAIGMYTNLLVDIENTLGKLAGVSGAREGQIQNREAVGNVEREVAQTSHITEKWFAIDQNFRKRALTKFLECCKYAYKSNPQKGQFLLDDLSQQFITHFDEFASTEYDLHLSNSTSDTQLYNDIKALSQAAIQNGQATISDLVAISQSDSVQDIAKKLENSAKRIKEENEQMQQQQMQQQQEMQQAQMQADREAKQIDLKKHDDKIAVDREKIQASLDIAAMKEVNNNYRTESGLMDSDSNGIADELDLRRTEIEEKRNDQKADLDQAKLDEQIRSNQAKEDLAKEKMSLERERTKVIKNK
jgi:hypothetical protein